MMENYNKIEKINKNIFFMQLDKDKDNLICYYKTNSNTILEEEKNYGNFCTPRIWKNTI